MSEIWYGCKGKEHIHHIECMPSRIQRIDDNHLMTRLVDSNEEEALLLELLHSKANSQDFIFKEPPLQHASRFGNRFESSIWYGSLLIETSLVEKAFYIFNFIRASDISYNKLLFESFTQTIKTQKGIDLSKNPFLKYRNTLSSPSSYMEGQRLGTAMRQEGIEAFYYFSARTQSDSINIGAFTQNAFDKPNNKTLQIWQCLTNATTVEFIHLSNLEKSKYTFPIDQFLIQGQLSFPAK